MPGVSGYVYLCNNNDAVNITSKNIVVTYESLHNNRGLDKNYGMVLFPSSQIAINVQEYAYLQQSW